MNSDTSDYLSEFSSERDIEIDESAQQIMQKKCVSLKLEGREVKVVSKYINPQKITCFHGTHNNICQIYQRDYTKQKVKLSGSGLIVQVFPQSQVQFQMHKKKKNSKAYYIIGLVLTCSHLDLNLQKPIYVTYQKVIPDKKSDYFELIPLFKQDFITRIDTFTDPLTGAQLSANDVNLFLLVVDQKISEKADRLSKLQPKINFMKKEDIVPGLEVYLGAYCAAPPINTKSKDKEQNQQEFKLYQMSPSLNLEYLKYKKEFLKNPKNQKAKDIVASFERTVTYSKIFNENRNLYNGSILKLNKEMAAASYSCYEGTSGGPILHHNGREVLIVGVNHGSAAVGDYTITKINELCAKQIMIPPGLKFNFSFIQPLIKKYIKSIQDFKKIQENYRVKFHTKGGNELEQSTSATMEQMLLNLL